MKRLMFVFIVFIVCFRSITVSAEGANTVLNAGFEDGSNGTASTWIQNIWDKSPGATDIKWDNNQKKSGSKSVCITNISANDSRLEQEIKVEENSLYRLSCWIRTENVGKDKKGANLSVSGLIDSTCDIRGTSEQWEKVELYGETSKEQDNLVVTVGLGGYGSTNTGKAWFDDVVVEKIDKLPVGVNAIKLYTSGESAGTTTENPSVSGKNSYNGPLIAYTVIYLLVAVFVYFIFRKNMAKVTESNARIILSVILGIGLVTRLIAGVKVEGFPVDIGCFKAWSLEAAKDLPNFYKPDMFCDYPPLYIYVLFVIGKLAGASWVGINHTLLVKLPAIFADVVTAYIICRLARKQFNIAIGLVLAGAYIFNPVALLDSSIWGQVDSFFTLLIAVALLLLVESKINLSSVVFAMAFLMKPQAIFFLPVLLFELIRRKSAKAFLQAFISAFITAVIIIIPFSRDPLWIVKLYTGTASGYTQASLNAYNLFSLLGANLKEDSMKLLFMSYKAWGLIFDVLVFSFAGFLYFRGKHKALPLIISVVLNTGAFVLSTRMHERYMFPVLALILLAFIYLKDKRLMYVFAVLTITNFININSVLYRMLTYDYPHVPPENMLMRIVSLVNVLIFVYIIKISIDAVLRDRIKAYIISIPSTVKSGIKGSKRVTK